MKIVRALVPDLTTAVCKAALEHCQLDGMEAAHMLQAFKRDRSTELQELHKVWWWGGGVESARWYACVCTHNICACTTHT